MTVATTTISINRRYLVSKSKERLISLYEQFTGERLLSDMRNEMRLKRHRELVEIVWKAWRDLPSPLLGEHRDGENGVEIWDGESWVPLQEAMTRIYSIELP